MSKDLLMSSERCLNIFGRQEFTFELVGIGIYSPRRKEMAIQTRTLPKKEIVNRIVVTQQGSLQKGLVSIKQEREWGEGT